MEDYYILVEFFDEELEIICSTWVVENADDNADLTTGSHVSVCLPPTKSHRIFLQKKEKPCPSWREYTAKIIFKHGNLIQVSYTVINV